MHGDVCGCTRRNDLNALEFCLTVGSDVDGISPPGRRPAQNDGPYKQNDGP